MDLKAPYMSLKTFKKSGAYVLTPVWFASTNHNQLYVFSSKNAGKIKRIRNNAASEISECNWKGEKLKTWEGARSFIVEDPIEEKEAYRALTAKYKWQMHLVNFFSWMSGRIKKRSVIRIEIIEKK